MYFERSLGFMISATNTKMKNHLAKTLEPYNVTHEQWVLLIRLWEQDRISQKELSVKSMKDQPTTARILDKLEKRGLIQRKANPEDRRSFLIYLTKEGQELETPLKGLVRQEMLKSFRGLTDEDQTQLRVLLKRIMDNLEVK
ncbi:MarR family transcriptional regulator [Neobacillus sp. PS3-40]|uniref:MarR family winged helix-turn-helix transcriptional regulator n=1 Tax=Neobacillus sp. PS3-40 TaxID=3070679 RepID=UPI0027E1BF7E|nr:MarR family transcriptional regulator [Neobacillus sp. PS3-40]WML42955.1 MarR family transcriptional regulator [Neobacillus sp. PS3-40]